MTIEYDKPELALDPFLFGLRALCRKHRVRLSVSGYDSLQLWPLLEGDDELYCPVIEDRRATESR